MVAAASLDGYVAAAAFEAAILEALAAAAGHGAGAAATVRRGRVCHSVQIFTGRAQRHIRL